MNKPKKRMNVVFEGSQFDEIREQAKLEDRTFANMARRLVREAVTERMETRETRSKHEAESA